MTIHDPASSAQASFTDDFNRPDTVFGLGNGWNMLGPSDGSLTRPAATDGFIRGGHYTYSGQSVVYAARQFNGTVRRIGTTGRFTGADGRTDTMLGMGITPNGQLTADMVNFTADRSTWELKLGRDNGDFTSLISGTFTPMLELNRDYTFEIDATDDAVTVTVPGTKATSEVATTGLVGDYAFWAEYPNATPADAVFEFDSVWADGDGQPLSPVTG